MHSLSQVGLGPLGLAMVRDLHARGPVLAAPELAPPGFHTTLSAPPVTYAGARATR